MDLMIPALSLDVHGDAPGVVFLSHDWIAAAPLTMIRINFPTNTCASADIVARSGGISRPNSPGSIRPIRRAPMLHRTLDRQQSVEARAHRLQEVEIGLAKH